MSDLAAALPTDVCPDCEIVPLSAADMLKDGVCGDCRHKRKRQEERESVCSNLVLFIFMVTHPVCRLLPSNIK